MANISRNFSSDLVAELCSSAALLGDPAFAGRAWYTLKVNVTFAGTLVALGTFLSAGDLVAGLNSAKRMFRSPGSAVQLLPGSSSQTLPIDMAPKRHENDMKRRLLLE